MHKGIKSFYIIITYILFINTALFSQTILKTADILFNEGMEFRALELYTSWLSQKQSSKQQNFLPILLRSAKIIENPELSLKLVKRYYSNLDEDGKYKVALFISSQSDIIGDLEEAYTYYIKAISLKPKDSELIVYRAASLLAEMGEKQKASKLLQPIIKKCKNQTVRASSIMLYSRLLAEQGQIEQAIKTASFVFKLKLKNYPPVTKYWLSFLIKNYPQKSNNLKKQYKKLKTSKSFNYFKPVPSPAMILSGLLSDSDSLYIEKKIVKSDNKIEKKPEIKTLKKDVTPLIQVGSFTDIENSQYFAKDVNKRGFETEIREDADKKHFRVFVVFDGKEPFEQLLLRLKDASLEGYLVFE